MSEESCTGVWNSDASRSADHFSIIEGREKVRCIVQQKLNLQWSIGKYRKSSSTFGFGLNIEFFIVSFVLALKISNGKFLLYLFIYFSFHSRTHSLFELLYFGRKQKKNIGSSWGVRDSLLPSLLLPRHNIISDPPKWSPQIAKKTVAARFFCAFSLLLV